MTIRPMTHRQEIEKRERIKNATLSCNAPSTGSIRQAKEEAVSAIYFDDSSDYRTALLNVVKHLDPELYDLMLIDRKAAFKKVSE